MRLLLIFIASFVLVSGVVFTKLEKGKSSNVGNENVLSEESGEDLPTEKQNNNSISTDKSISSETEEFTNTPTPSSVIIHEDNINLESFKYPGSEIINSDLNSFLLKTADDPDDVTAWYKGKITSEKMGVKSFVTTKTNDNVLNKLVGAKNGLEVIIEIKKNEGDAIAEIVVLLEKF